jgi:hypothetical protein
MPTSTVGVIAREMTRCVRSSLTGKCIKKPFDENRELQQMDWRATARTASTYFLIWPETACWEVDLVLFINLENCFRTVSRREVIAMSYSQLFVLTILLIVRFSISSTVRRNFHCCFWAKVWIGRNTPTPYLWKTLQHAYFRFTGSFRACDHQICLRVWIAPFQSSLCIADRFLLSICFDFVSLAVFELVVIRSFARLKGAFSVFALYCWPGSIFNSFKTLHPTISIAMN